MTSCAHQSPAPAPSHPVGDVIKQASARSAGRSARSSMTAKAEGERDGRPPDQPAPIIMDEHASGVPPARARGTARRGNHRRCRGRRDTPTCSRRAVRARSGTGCRATAPRPPSRAGSARSTSPLPLIAATATRPSARGSAGPGRSARECRAGTAPSRRATRRDPRRRASRVSSARRRRGERADDAASTWSV